MCVVCTVVAELVVWTRTDVLRALSNSNAVVSVAILR